MYIFKYLILEAIKDKERNIPSSQKQARMLGVIAGGGDVEGVDISKTKAHDILRGKKIKKLPVYSKTKAAKKVRES